MGGASLGAVHPVACRIYAPLVRIQTGIYQVATACHSNHLFPLFKMMPLSTDRARRRSQFPVSFLHVYPLP